MLEIQTESAGETVTVAAFGEVDLEVSPDFWTAIEGAIAITQRLRIRLADVSYIDSSGIATLVKALRHAQKYKVDFALIDPSDQVRAVIELAQLDRLFKIETSAQ